MDTRQYKTTEAQRRASKAYRERMKQFDPQAYKAKVKEYNETAKEKRLIDLAEWEAEREMMRDVERYYRGEYHRRYYFN